MCHLKLTIAASGMRSTCNLIMFGCWLLLLCGKLVMLMLSNVTEVRVVLPGSQLLAHKVR